MKNKGRIVSSRDAINWPPTMLGTHSRRDLAYFSQQSVRSVLWSPFFRWDYWAFKSNCLDCTGPGRGRFRIRMEECHAASSAAAMGVSSYWLVEVPCSAEAHQPPANLLLVQEAPLGTGLGSSLPIPAPYRELSGGLCVKSIVSFLCHSNTGFVFPLCICF